MISFPCICGENWFCRRSVATFQSDVIQGPERGLFATIFRIRAPFSRDRYPPFSRRRKTSPQRRRNPFPRAGISFSGYAAAPPSPGDVPFFHSGDHLRMSSFLSSGNGHPQAPGRTLLISSVIRSGPSRTGPQPGAGQDLRLFSSYLYIRRHTTVLSCQKEHKKTGTHLASRSLSLTPKYIAVTERNVPM